MQLDNKKQQQQHQQNIWSFCLSFYPIIHILAFTPKYQPNFDRNYLKTLIQKKKNKTKNNQMVQIIKNQ